MSLGTCVQYAVIGALSLAGRSQSSPDTPFDRAGLDVAEVRLTSAPYPEGVADEADYVAWIAERTAALREAAQRTEDPLGAVSAWLALVNWRLAAECEPPLSRMLQGLALPEDSRRVIALTDECVRTLDLARTRLEETDEDAEAAAQDTADLEASIDILQTFAEAFHAFALPADDDKAADAGRQAARSLSLYLEDQRPKVARAALLWQAVLYGRSDRPDRAIRLLPLVTEAPRREALRYDFFTRLLRCRLLVHRRSFAAAWTLALHLESRSYDWFGEHALRTAASRSMQLVKLRICEEWPDAVARDERAGTAEWCASIASRLRDEHLDNGGVMRLESAAPFVVDIRDPAELRSVPASPPDDAAKPDAAEAPGDAPADRPDPVPAEQSEPEESPTDPS